MNESFAPYGGPGQDARIRSELSTVDGDRRRHTAKEWNSTWESRFTKERNNAAQRKAYDQFLEELAHDLKL